MTTTATTTTAIRRLTAAVAAPLAAAGILLGGLAMGAAPTAGAQPGDGQCSQMPMTNGRSGPTPSALTRAGMINAAAGPSASDGSMPANCAPAGHS